jgi:lysophospholipase L1-like esterase
MERRTFLLGTAALLAASGTAPSTARAAAVSAIPNLLVYGDSNTWGWRPTVEDEPLPRYADDERWAGVLQHALGRRARVTVNGLMARTFGADLARGVRGLSGEDHNGLKRLSLALLENSPVNLLVVMLGTNDMMASVNRSPADVAQDVARLAELSTATIERHPHVTAPGVVLIAPPPLGDASKAGFANAFPPASVAKSRELGNVLGAAAKSAGFAFVDAGSIITTDGADGVHLTLAAHRKLGLEVASAVRRLMRGD